MSTKKPQILPLNNLVLGVQEKTADRTKSGFILPEQAKKATGFTRVIATGEEVTAVSVGDRIAYKLYAEHQITYEDQEYLLIDETDILAKVEVSE